MMYDGGDAPDKDDGEQSMNRDQFDQNTNRAMIEKHHPELDKLPSVHGG